MAVIRSYPEKFCPVMGDKMPDNCEFPGEDQNNLALRPNCVSSISDFKELDNFVSPTLQVIKSKMDWEESTKSKKVNSLHFTHLRLCDGSKDVMMGRLSMQLAHSGNYLNTGDIIQLNSFTPLTYTPSGQDKPQRSPAVVIHTCSKVGYREYLKY